MFLVERLVGLGIYCYFLLMVCLLIAFSNIKLRNITRFYTAALALMGFFYEPYKTADLFRINESLSQFSNYSFTNFFRTFAANSSVPAARIYYWLISKTGVYALLPAITCIICYSCIFYIFVRSAEIYKIDRKNVAVAMLFFMSTGSFIMVISNIRTMLSVSLICFCTFRETVEKKYNAFNLLIYGFAALLHNLALIVLAVRIAIIIIDKRTTLVRRIVFSVIFIAGLALAAVKFPFIFNSVFEKAMSYITGDSYSYIWDYITAAFIFIIEAVVVIKYIRSGKKSTELISIKNFLIICLLLAIAFCLFIFTISWIIRCFDSFQSYFCIFSLIFQNI